MLLQLRDFIRKSKVVSTQQLSREFHIDLSALQPMLDLWEKKGAIKKCQEKANCGSACFKCKPKQLEYYEYLLTQS